LLGWLVGWLVGWLLIGLVFNFDIPDQKRLAMSSAEQSSAEQSELLTNPKFGLSKPKSRLFLMSRIFHHTFLNTTLSCKIAFWENVMVYPLH
jgi:hypothetical protein